MSELKACPFCGDVPELTMLQINNKDELIDQLQARIKELETELNNICFHASNQEELLSEQIVQANTLRINAEQKIKELKYELKIMCKKNISLSDDVTQLESQSHINEIKAQGIEDYLTQKGDSLLFSQRKALNDYLDTLRTK